MITLEPPRRLTAAHDAEAWRALGLSRSGLAGFMRRAQVFAGLPGEVSVLLTDDRVLRRLNHQWRGKDQATDVLSFPAPAELSTISAGDLAVSLETAARQAEEQGHTLRDEVRVLLLHGLLHLSGMDHERDNGEMALREAELRKKLRLKSGLIARTTGNGQQGRAKSKSKRRFPAGMRSQKNEKVGTRRVVAE